MISPEKDRALEEKMKALGIFESDLEVGQQDLFQHPDGQLGLADRQAPHRPLEAADIHVFRIPHRRSQIIRLSHGRR